MVVITGKQFYKPKKITGMGILCYNMYKILLIVQFKFSHVKS